MRVAGRTFAGVDEAFDACRHLQLDIAEGERLLLRSRTRLGLMLIDLRSIVGRGRWLVTLDGYGIHRRMAQRSMRLAEDAIESFPDQEVATAEGIDRLLDRYAKKHRSCRAAEQAIRMSERPVPAGVQLDFYSSPAFASLRRVLPRARSVVANADDQTARRVARLLGELEGLLCKTKC